MKRGLFSFAGLLLTALVLSGCSNNTPKAAATRWLYDLYHRDYEKAKKESTDNTKELIADFAMLSQKEPDSSKEQLKREKVTIKDVKEQGDKATVTYTTTDDPNPQTLHLVKEKGKWLVELSKDDQMEESAAPTGTDTSSAPPTPEVTDTPSAK